MAFLKPVVGPQLLPRPRDASPQQDVPSLQSPLAAPFHPPVADEPPARALRRSVAGMRSQKRRNPTARIVVVATVLAMIGAAVAMLLYKPSRDVWVVNALDHAVIVQIGKDQPSFTVQPRDVAYRRLVAGDYDVVVQSPDGYEIERARVTVPADREFACYNVLGATFLTLVRYNFKQLLDTREEELIGRWVTAKRADWAFEPVPATIPTFTGDQLIRYAVEAYPEKPDWRVTQKLLRADSREQGADLIARVCMAAPAADPDRDGQAVEEIARAYGSKRGEKFLDELHARRPISPEWRAAMEDLLDRLVRGGAANIDSGGDPDKPAWVDLDGD